MRQIADVSASGGGADVGCSDNVGNDAENVKIPTYLPFRAEFLRERQVKQGLTPIR